MHMSNRILLDSRKITSKIGHQKNCTYQKKYIHENKAPFMTKELHNAIMKRSRYKNKFLKDKTQSNRENYKNQQNFCKKLSRKTKKLYLDSLQAQKIWITELFGRLLFVFLKKRCQKVKRLFLMKQKNIFLIRKNMHNF